MSEIRLEVDGHKENVRAFWVHLQNASAQQSAELRITIPTTYASRVFDPYNTKELDTSWPNFIEDYIAKFGTFIVEGFIENIAAIIGEREKVYIWVIASIDEISETENAIELIGRVVPFMNRGS